MVRFYIVNAYATGPFTGNPAAVVLLEARTVSATWMQAVAAQFGLPETAFLSPADDASYGLRWFTPTVEVDLCGHATTAAATVVAGDADSRVVAFQTRSGPLRAWVDSGQVTIDLPADPSDDPADTGAIEDVLGQPVVRSGAGKEYVVAELESAASVVRAKPDLTRVGALGRTGLVITAATDGEVVCRMFSPQCGIDEDPVTGSAWCALAPWWRGRRGPSFAARQLSARGGHLGVELTGNRVQLTGKADIVADGHLHI